MSFRNYSELLYLSWIGFSAWHHLFSDLLNTFSSLSVSNLEAKTRKLSLKFGLASNFSINSFWVLFEVLTSFKSSSSYGLCSLSQFLNNLIIFLIDLGNFEFTEEDSEDKGSLVAVFREGSIFLSSRISYCYGRRVI